VGEYFYVQAAVFMASLVELNKNLVRVIF